VIQAYLDLPEVLGRESIVGSDLTGAGQLYHTPLEQLAIAPESKGLLDSPTGTGGVNSSARHLAAREGEVHIHNVLTWHPP
jgi:hypothetical protein